MYREIELRDVLTRLCAAYPQMRVVDGWKLMPHVPSAFADGLHPNDYGMALYANGVVKALK